MSLTAKPVFDKGLVLPDKLIHLSKTLVKCLGIPLGYANAQPPSHNKIAKCPTPGTDNTSKCPTVAQERMATNGID